MHSIKHSSFNFWLIIVAMATACAVYWPGLSGSFLFDDYGNIASVNDWQAGRQGYLITLLPNASSVVHSRPVSMASFMISAWLGGGGPFAYKLGNLLVHLACGGLVFAVLRLALSADRTLSARMSWAAGFLAAIWLVHPLHASTVLYVVQRMAQLSTLFTLLAVTSYLVGRRRLISGKPTAAAFLLFGIFPLFLVTGLLSKQNSAIAPFLCLVLEIAYFSVDRTHRRTMIMFFVLFALLPLFALSALLLTAPQFLLGGYADWDFDLTQRLLTQPRALLSYIEATLLPNGPRMGIYTDDFIISKSLFDPPATAFAMGALTAISLAAIAVRRRAPSIFAGWGFFLVAHGVESTFLPLEMYYEHRNYLPSVGLLLATAGSYSLVSSWFVHKDGRLYRTEALLMIGIFAVLAFATLGRALVWQSAETIVSQAVRQHPDSMRAMLDQAVIHIQHQDYQKAISITNPLRNSDDPRKRVVGNLQSVAVQCMRGQAVDTAAMQRAVDSALPKVTVFELQMARLLLLATPNGRCGNHSTQFIAEGLEKLLTSAPTQIGQPSSQDVMRVITAQLYARAGDWQAAERQATLAWSNQVYLPAGALLVRIYLHNRKSEQALFTIQQLESKVRSFDTVSQKQLSILRALVTDRSKEPKSAYGGGV